MNLENELMKLDLLFTNNSLKLINESIIDYMSSFVGEFVRLNTDERYFYIKLLSILVERKEQLLKCATELNDKLIVNNESEEKNA